MNTPNRIDQTSSTSNIRQSTNLTIDRQTPKSDFGDRVKAGLESAASAVSQGAALAAPFVPGGAIVSAAVSSVSQMSASVSAPSAGTGQYVSAVTSVGGTGGINTTVGAGGGLVSPSSVVTGGMGSSGGVSGSGSGTSVGQMNSELIRAQQENMELMKVQIAMQRENQVFSTVSNVMKTRHDTVKNTIANVR